MPLVGLVLWLSVVSSGAEIGYTNSQVVSYFLMAAFLSVATNAWHSWFFNEEIRNGEVNKYLLKPYSPFWALLSDNLTQKVFQLSFMVVVITLISYYLLGGWNLGLNLTLGLIILFVISLINAVLISFIIDLLIGVSGFWFHDVDFLNGFFSIAGNIFSGKMIPLVLLPTTIFNLVSILPFRYIISFPIEVLMSREVGVGLLGGLSIQVFWLIILALMYKALYAQGLKSYSSYGS